MALIKLIIGIIGGIFGLVVGLLGGLFGLVVGLFGAVFGLAVTGIVLLVLVAPLVLLLALIF
jgi:hypothetical protein